MYYASLIGYFKALWLGFTHVLQIMLMNCENIEKHTKKIFDVDYEKLVTLAYALLVNINEGQQNNILKLIETSADESQKKMISAMMKAIEQDYKEEFPLFGAPGVYSYSIMGSHLPTNANQKCAQVSIFTKQTIRGLAFAIDSGASVISIEEALEWALVNKFTPCNNGTIINPF